MHLMRAVQRFQTRRVTRFRGCQIQERQCGDWSLKEAPARQYVIAT